MITAAISPEDSSWVLGPTISINGVQIANTTSPHLSTPTRQTYRRLPIALI